MSRRTRVRTSRMTILTPAQAARYLKVNRVTLYAYLQRRQLPAHKIGARWFLTQETLDAWLAEQMRNHCQRLRHG